MNRRNLNKKKQTQYQTVNYALKGGFAMNRKVIYKNEDGEYMPFNMNDELLLKACIQYNDKIKNGEVTDDGVYPIQTNLIYYYYHKDSKVRLFGEWCNIQNNMLREARKNKNIQEKRGKTEDDYKED